MSNNKTILRKEDILGVRYDNIGTLTEALKAAGANVVTHVHDEIQVEGGDPELVKAVLARVVFATGPEFTEDYSQ